MTTTAIVNIGTLVSGNIQEPLLQADLILIENDKIAAVGASSEQIKGADTVIDAAGMTLTPGLIDSHTHPSIGDYSPRLNVVGWIEHYPHGGITSMISLGELHVPGRPHDPAGVKALAILASKCYRNVPRGSVKVMGGTLILESPRRRAISRKWPARAFARSNSSRPSKIELKRFNSRSGRRNTACAS